MGRHALGVSAAPRVSGRAALTAEQASWVDAASARVTEDRLRDLAVAMTSIASPTGGEAPLAHSLVEQLTRAGVEARAQHLDADQANAVGCVQGSGGGGSLMLYAPIDTLTTGDAALDVPWVGLELRPDMRPVAHVDGPYVSGLGASNPKGHGACVLAAVEAIRSAGVPLRGDLIAGFGAGGMPANARPGQRADVGQGVGCGFMLEHGPRPDFAVIAKPGWTVSWEEVGLAWFEIRVHGTHTYVGSRHRLPYRNPIHDAAVLVDALEAWFPQYAREHTDGTVAPQGIVAAIEGGWPHLAAVTPATCRLVVDLRLSPRTTAEAAQRSLTTAVDDVVGANPGMRVDVERVLAIPGTVTPVDSFVVQATAEAWEAAEGREHEVVRDGSGATDANILRAHGVPTARIGMPKVSDIGAEVDFSRGMNTVDVREMARLTRLLVRIAINVCTRERAELGLRPGGPAPQAPGAAG
jgi:acetylornithine deacetylase/succinyl-diaminopimelate desuccinylase-like protein